MVDCGFRQDIKLRLGAAASHLDGGSRLTALTLCCDRVGHGRTANKITMGAVAAFATAIALAMPAHADTSEQDQQFLSALRSAGWTIGSASGLVTEGHMICNEGLAHGVSAQEIRANLLGKGYSSVDSATLIRKAVSTYCPRRQDAIAGVGNDPSPASRDANGEWWDTPSQGQAVCSIAKVSSRDWTVNNGIGDFNGTSEGAHFVDALIAKYCPQYAD